MNFDLKNIIRHILVISGFALISIVFFYPVIQGKALYQSDIALYKGMAKERDDFKKETGIESYWTNSAFGGMPTYQLGANYPHNYVKKLDRIIRFLPRPADYLFLYLIGFYILLLAIPLDWKVAVVGSIAFAFSTYFIIILDVGHNAKAHAIAYLPVLLAGILLVFRKKYVIGFFLAAMGMALEVSANHFQMTYYFMLLVIILGVVKLVYAIKNREIAHYGKSLGILLLAVLLGVACNTTNLLATQEYAQWSTRGKSELTITPDGNPKENIEGLDYDYITQYSYGIFESLDLIYPRLLGGSNGENLGKDSKAYQFLTSQGISSSRAAEFSENLPLYWGDQLSVAGPAYLGAIIVFLALLGLFILPAKNKWWIGLTILVILFLSWGKNFGGLTRFMVENFPLYNKFRAVSSIQVIIELCVPLLAFLALGEILKKKENREQFLKPLFLATGGLLALGLGLLAIKSNLSFDSFRDATLVQYYGPELMEIIKADRKQVFTSDILRSSSLILIVGALIWLFLKSKLKETQLVIVIGILIVYDLGAVAYRYVTEDDFVNKRRLETPFTASNVDEAILEDPSHFRVLNPQEGLNGSRTSYFHKSLGGYHAAKPRKIEELFDFHLYQNNTEVLNMLNVKYLLQEDENGNMVPSVNEEANGTAWFIEQLRAVPNANEEILKLNELNTKSEAVFNKSKHPNLKSRTFELDSTASAYLTTYTPNKLTYNLSNEKDGFLVFSEMFYPKGWQVSLDGKMVDHYQVNYVLRGMPVPAGTHKIVFEFIPEVVNKGSRIALAAQGILGLLLVVALAWGIKTGKARKAQNDA